VGGRYFLPLKLGRSGCASDSASSIADGCELADSSNVSYSPSKIVCIIPPGTGSATLVSMLSGMTSPACLARVEVSHVPHTIQCRYT
jgi:hypothetical protein